MKKQLVNSVSLVLPMGLVSGAIAQQSAYLRNYTQSYLRQDNIDSSSAGILSELYASMADTDYHKGNRLPGPVTSIEELTLTRNTNVRELIIVDADVPDSHVFYQQLKPGFAVREIDNRANGLEQLAKITREFSNLEAIHIISHGTEGLLYLGDSKIDQLFVLAHKTEMATVKSSLAQGADIHFYACELAATKKGEEFVELVANVLEADVAASNNLTGNASNGADWDLEIVKGDINTVFPFSKPALKDFTETLNSLTVEASSLYQNETPFFTSGEGIIARSDGTDYLRKSHVNNSQYMLYTYYSENQGNSPIRMESDQSYTYTNYSYGRYAIRTFELEAIQLCNASRNSTTGNLSLDVTVKGYVGGNLVTSEDVTITTLDCLSNIDSETVDLTGSTFMDKQLEYITIFYKDNNVDSDIFPAFVSFTIDPDTDTAQCTSGSYYETYINTSMNPSAPNSRYSVNGDGTVLDTETNLEWMQCRIDETWDSSTCTGSPGGYTWSQAIEAAESHTFGGHSDWRLPNRKELSSLVERACHSPAINKTIFPSETGDFIWTSTPYAGSGSQAWKVSFEYGQSYHYTKLGSYYVRLVRDADL